MNILKQILNFLLSLRTTIWLLGISLVLLFAGAFIMPASEEFQLLHSTPLFEWIQNQPLQLTWWLWSLIGILAVLAVNTLFCSIESIISKRKVTHWLLLISPQIIHVGFLFILLAHLLSGIGASQGMTGAVEGSVIMLSGDDTELRVKEINMNYDSYGYLTDWDVSVEYLSAGDVLYRDMIKPNQPSTRMGFNINVKDLRPFPVEAVLLQINREPGALWALIGGILFTVGIVTLILLKIRMER
ncbi:MAG: cytochrome C biogenesis protein ResB [Nitrospiraceae bacterium]|nr:MAG: cytochrome C biogenesis protein ResB [Nitrospiraceae bacterium]